MAFREKKSVVVELSFGITAVVERSELCMFVVMWQPCTCSCCLHLQLCIGARVPLTLWQALTEKEKFWSDYVCVDEFVLW